MKKIYILTLLLLFAAAGAKAKEIEIIPYKVATPTDEFTIQAGIDYAKLVGLAASLRKDVTITEFTKSEESLKRLSLTQQSLITEDNIIRIGYMGKADYILIGTLSRKKGSYISDSILYSMYEKKIVAKNHSSSNTLFNLAAEEMKEAFFDFPDKGQDDSRLVDASIVLDTSYKVSAEWESIKKGIKDFASAVSENWDTDTQINILPFSVKEADLNKLTGIKSMPALSEKLDLILPSGNSITGAFEKTLSYAVKNAPWRRNSDKILILISNSEKTAGRFPERYAIEAKRKKMAVRTISLGLIKGDSIEPLRQFAIAGAGTHYTASYHLRFFDEKGDPLDVFYQGGRLFSSLVYNNSWQNGLFEENNARKNSLIEKPRSFLDEIFYNEKKYNINPYNLNKLYPLLSQSHILNSEKQEDNIAQLMRRIGETFESRSAKTKYVKSIAKVQVTDGRVSVWLQIKKDEDLEVFAANEAGSSPFPLGVVIKKSREDPYGISFSPEYITGFTDDAIPSMLKTSIYKIVKSPNHYMRNGLLNPPLWFINVRVQKIERLTKEYDIREMGIPE